VSKSGICPSCQKRFYFSLEDSRHLEIVCPNCGCNLEIYDGPIGGFEIDASDFGDELHTQCAICGKEIDNLTMWYCEDCGKFFCYTHRKHPHLAVSVVEDSESADKSMFFYGFLSFIGGVFGTWFFWEAGWIYFGTIIAIIMGVIFMIIGIGDVVSE